MNYNFDEIINRNGTDSVKWDAVERRWGRNDLIPMWVADMIIQIKHLVLLSPCQEELLSALFVP